MKVVLVFKKFSFIDSNVYYYLEKFFDELTNAVQSLKQSVTGDTIALRVDSANILILPEKSDSVSNYDDENDITAADTIYQHSQFTCKRLLDMLPSEDSSERSKCRKAGNYSKVCFC